MEEEYEEADSRMAGVYSILAFTLTDPVDLHLHSILIGRKYKVC